MIKFYKGVLESDLFEGYIPGTVTTDIKVAAGWRDRIQGRKAKGAAKHVRHGKACVIAIEYEGSLQSWEEFQRAGVAEHARGNCWTSTLLDKAQVNTPVKFRRMTDDEVFEIGRC